MKKIINYILLLSLPALFGACKKYLEKPPEGNIEESIALKSETDVKAVINSCYIKLGNDGIYSGNLQRTAEMLADHLDGSNLNGKPQEIYLRRTTIFNTDNAGLFTDLYNTIYRVNKALENLALVTADKDKVDGEAKFIRAICHFEVARLWSHNPGFTNDDSHPGITIKTSSAISVPQRSTVKETYEKIISDLKDAESKLPDFNENRLNADKNAARAFLAKVYFQMNKFSEAYNYADLVIKSNHYSLAGDLTSRYTPAGSTEAILRISNVLGQHEPGGSLRGGFSGRNGLPFLRFSKSVYDFVKSQTGDQRLAWLDGDKFSGNVYLTKYDASNFELPVVFLTEMLLIRAEAGGEIGTAESVAAGVSDINKIIERAYGNSSKNLSVNTSASLLINKVREQREIEMVGENGDRLHEIKRIGAHPNAARRIERLDRRGSEWNCPGFILQFPDYEKNANAAFQLNVEGGCL